MRVTSALDVGPGRFFYDSSAHKLWIGSAPTGHVVEAAVLPLGWQGYGKGADNVLITGLTIEHVGGTGIQGPGDWDINAVESRWNHLNGVEGPLSLLNNDLHDNGQAGFEENCQCSTSQTPHLFTGNEVADNNNSGYAGYSISHDASGMKFMQTGNIVVTNNYVHDNGGPGLWSDTNVIDGTYVGNRVLNNTGPGIEIEVSYSHTIANNDIEENDGPGISILDTGPADVYGNNIENNNGGIQETQINRGYGLLGYYSINNVQVHNNLIALTRGWSGLKVWEPSLSYYISKGNSWNNNTYTTTSCTTNDKPFVWLLGSQYADLAWSQWLATGNDSVGGVVC